MYDSNNDFWLEQEDMRKTNGPDYDKVEVEEEDDGYDDYLYDMIKDLELENE